MEEMLLQQGLSIGEKNKAYSGFCLVWRFFVVVCWFGFVFFLIIR